MRWVAIAFALVTASWSGAQVITADFASEPPGVPKGARWDLGGLGWSIRDSRLLCEAGGRTTAVPTAVPHGRAMVYETVMRPVRSVGTQWKTAGIAIALDEANYWQLALVEGPDANGKARTFELHEMLGGRWLANLEGDTALKVTAQETVGGPWEYGREYRMRLVLDEQGIAGSIEEIGSDRAYRIAYAFAGKCVRAGRPILVSGGISASYASYRADIRSAVALPKTAPPPAYTRPPMTSVRSRATGFFRVEKIGGRWWVMDPRGVAFYVVGTDHVNYNAHWCEKLGYAPYSRNVQAKYGSEEKWAASAVARLKAWGFNTLGAGHSEATRHRGLVHTAFLSLGTMFTAYGDIAPRTTWTGFPDVFDPNFEQYCNVEARKQCAPHREDPWLLGYFLDNELEWFGKNGSETGLVDEAMKKPAGHPAKVALVGMLKKRHTSISGLNAAWKSSFASWETFASATEAPAGPGAMSDRRDFVRLIAERYFAVTCEAIRRADPNHMIIGCRFAGIAPPIWDIAGRHLDIVSVNYYGSVNLEKGTTTDMSAAMARYHAESRRPLLITEWSFPALDAGLPSRHGAGQRVATQADKARAYAIYQTALFSMPHMVGSHYFMWVDEPALGISSTFPEDSNYGLVDVDDRPWPELTAMAAKLNPRAVAIRSGATAEVSARIGERDVTVANSGTRLASFAADISVNGARRRQKVRVAPGKVARLPLGALGTGPALVTVELDREGALVECDLSDNRASRVVGRASPGTVVVVNPGPEPLADAPVVVRLPKDSPPMAVANARGVPLRSQTDRMPEGTELVFVADRLPAGVASVFRMRPSASGASARADIEGGAFAFAGVLGLSASGMTGNVLDAVRLGDQALGRLTVLVHQTGGQPLWTPPDRIVRTRTFTGPLRTVRIVECAGGGGGAITAADTSGTYAPQQSRPGRFTATVRMDAYAQEPWFGVRILGIRNADTTPWRLEAYLVYPLSSIAGSASDDDPGGTGDAPRWHDSTARASYGAVVDTGVFRGMFWKDTPTGEGQHPDIMRAVGRTLRPGESYAVRDPEVRIFGVRGDSAALGHADLRRMRALARLRVLR